MYVCVSIYLSVCLWSVYSFGVECSTARCIGVKICDTFLLILKVTVVKQEKTMRLFVFLKQGLTGVYLASEKLARCVDHAGFKTTDTRWHLPPECCTPSVRHHAWEFLIKVLHNQGKMLGLIKTGQSYSNVIGQKECDLMPMEWEGYLAWPVLIFLWGVGQGPFWIDSLRIHQTLSRSENWFVLLAC